MYKKCLSFIKCLALKAKFDEKGLTLIETAIWLMVVGILVLPLLHMLTVEKVQESKVGTKGDLARVQSGINQYYESAGGAYPCPASLILAPGHPDLGVADADCVARNFASLNLCPDMTTGVCKTTNTEATAVIIGAVPFSNILMYEKDTLDFWKNKFIYAVTYEQTDVATFTSNPGQIVAYAVDNREDDANNTYGGSDPRDDGVPDLEPEALDLFIFSTGLTGRGGYGKDGAALAPCGDPNFSSGTGYDNENCDLDNEFFYDLSPADLDTGAMADVPGPEFYDDLTRAQELVPVGLWFEHPDNVTYADDYVITSSSRVGVKTPDPQETVEVNGRIRVEDDPADPNSLGGVKSDDICDVGEVACFNPNIITDELDEMKCDPSSDTLPGLQPVRQLDTSQVRCGAPNDDTGSPVQGVEWRVDASVLKGHPGGGAAGRCPQGQLVTGFNANGEIICIVPP